MKNPCSLARGMAVSLRNNTGLKKTVDMLAGAVFLSAALGACTMPITVLFANHTAHSVTVFYPDGRDRPASLVVAPGEATRIVYLMSRNFSLQTQGSTLSYERALPPEPYIRFVGFGPFTKRVLKAQMENDGCVYLIEGDEPIPSQVPKAQPPEFPLCPVKTSTG